MRNSVKFIAANQSFKEQLGLVENDENRLISRVMGLPTQRIEPVQNQLIGRQTFGTLFKAFAHDAALDLYQEQKLDVTVDQQGAEETYTIYS